METPPRPDPLFSPADLASSGIEPNARRLDDFVVGPCNRQAYVAVRSMLMCQENQINPLFVHGPSGVGKTHLMQGLALAFKELHPTSNVLYLRCEHFTNDFIEAVENGEAAMAEFRARMRHPDLLLVEDIHFLNKGQMEEARDELFAAITHLIALTKKVVFTSDASLENIECLAAGFVQRFAGGLAVPLEHPDPQVRREIVARRARRQGCELSDEVAEYIAIHVTPNARMLEGVVDRLLKSSNSGQATIDLSTVRHCIQDLMGRAHCTITLAMIRQEVATFFGIQKAELEERHWIEPHATARQVVIYLLRQLSGATYGTVARQNGLKRYSCAIYACDLIEHLRGKDVELDAFIAAIITRINQERRKMAVENDWPRLDG